MGIIVVESGEHDGVLDSALDDQTEHVLEKTGFLELNVDDAAAGEVVQDLRQQRRRFAVAGVELAQSIVAESRDEPGSIGRTIDRRVMNDDDLAVAATADIQLDAVGAALQS
jgi:hypothetical protein